MDWDAFMETVEHQTTVPAKLDGKDRIAIFVFHCQDVNKGLVRMLSSAIVMRDGREHTATFPAAPIALTVNVSHPMNVFAIMDGLVKAVMSVNPWLDVFMDTAWIILTLVSVRVGGKDTFVTSRPALWIVIMVSATLQELPIPPTSASAILGGEVRAVTSAAPTGDAPIRVMMLATTPMNASASRPRMTLSFCVTIQFSFNT